MITPSPSAEQIAALVAQLRKYGGAVRIGGKPLTPFIVEAANALESLQADHEKLTKKLAEAEKALEFYADVGNWDFCLNTETGGRARFLKDGDKGDCARAALAKLKE